MHPFSKKAGLEPGTKVKVHPTAPGLVQSYPGAKWLTEPTEVELIDYAPNQRTLDVLDVKLPDGREESIYDFNIDEVVSIPAGNVVSPSPTEELVNIETLPTLDKPKKIDELLEQLSIETDPTKKEKIKQHIERIKRGSLKQADELGESMSPIQPAIDRGQKEVSKFDPEYEFLVRLVKLISKTSPEAIPEIKALSQAQPFHTIDDVGDLTAKIWTLATTKYNIPREWLISKLPEKKGSLNKKAEKIRMEPREGGRDFPVLVNPSFQEASGLLHKSPEKTLRYIPGDNLYIWDAYNADHIYVLDTLSRLGYSLEGFHGGEEYLVSDEEIQNYFRTHKKADLWPAQEAASEGTITQAPGQIAYNPTQEKDTSVSGPNPIDLIKQEFLIKHSRWSEVIKNLRAKFPNLTDEDIASLKTQTKATLTSSKQAKRKLNMDQVIKILDSKENKVDHIDFTTNEVELLNGERLSFEEATSKAMEIDKTGLFQGSEFSHSDTITTAPESSPEDHGKKPQKQPFPNTNWLPADDENKDEQPYSNIASSKKAFCKKEAASGYVGYWIDPNGKVFLTPSTHQAWALNNADKIEPEYGIHIDDRDPINSLKNAGWARVLINENTIQIEVKDFANLSFLDFWLAKYWNDNYKLLVLDDGQRTLNLTDPFPSLEEAVNKAKRHSFSKKELKLVKKAEESPLSQEDQNEISASSCPAYVIAVNNFYSANTLGHDKNRSLAYAVDSVKNLEKIDEKKLVEFINTYLGPIK